MPDTLPGSSSPNRELLSPQEMQSSSVYILGGTLVPSAIGVWRKPEKGCPLLPALLMGGAEECLSWGAGLQHSGVGATDGGVSSIYSKGVAGCKISDGGTWAPVSPSSEEEDKIGGVEICSKRLCSSLWTILWVLGTWRWSAIVITLLKEGQGPCLKEEVTGSETASRCSIPCGVKCAMECPTGAGPEAVVMKWTLPYFVFFPFPALPLFFFFPWLLPPAGGAA